MTKENLAQKLAPQILERVVFFVIGSLSFIVVPFCFLASLALISSVFGVLPTKYKISIFYAMPFAILFGFLGVLLAAVGWRLVRYKQAQHESLLVPFGKWFRDLGWLFAFTFGGDGINDIINGDIKGISKLMIMSVLLFAIRKGRRMKKALIEDKDTANT